MELKQGLGRKGFDRKTVLIVPLWNWNWGAAIGGAFGLGFNRTFMELKLSCLWFALD